MEKLCLFLIIGLLSSEALGKSFRNKRQSEDDDKENLEDRYGWNRVPQSQGQFPSQGFGQNQGMFPDQFTGQGQFSNQGRFPTQGIFPNQFTGQGQFSNQGQFPSQGIFPNQFTGQGQFPNQFTGQGQFSNQFTGQGQFPNQVQIPNQGQQPTGSSGNTNGNTNGNSLTQSSTYIDCIRRCPVTSEYNPVCGSDSVTYDNPGRLTCAQNCGLNVSQFRTSRCPATTVAPPTS